MNNGDLGNGDIIDGGTGTDTLFAVINTGDGTAVSLGRPVISNVETVEIELVEAAAGTQAGDTNVLNLDKSSGIKTVAVKNYTFATTADTTAITGVTTATSLKITDDNGHASARANNFTMTYDAVTGTADSASVEISSTVAATVLANITVAGVETLTVSSTGGAGAGYKVVAADATALTLNASAKSGGAVDLNAAKVVTLNINSADDLSVADAGGASAKLRTVNIDTQTADKTVTLTTLTPTPTAAATDAVVINVKGAGKAAISIDTDFDTQSATNADTVTVNAATNTGGVSFTTSAKAANKVTGGTGNDAVTLGAALDKDDVIALGEGTADTLTATATYAAAAGTVANVFYTDTLTGADLPTISSVEVARFNIAGTAAANTISAKSAAFASTVEFNAATAATTGADVDNNNLTISNLKAGQTVKFGSNLLIDDSTITLEVIDASTNKADVLNITTDGLNATATATFEGITAANIETVSIDLASTDKDNTTIAAGTLTFADATSVTLTGSKITTATVDAKDGATIDASAMTGTIDLTAATADKYTIKGSSTKATKFIMSTGLNNDDTIVGGSATTDSLTATVTGLTATTGVLKISGVETLDLTNTTTAVVDLTGTTGVKTVSINGAHATDDVATLKGLAADTQVTLGNGTTAHVGTLTVALADATGANDSLTLNLTGAGTGGITNLTTAGIETLNIVGSATMDEQNINVLNVDAKKIVVTGGHTTPVRLELTGGTVATPGTEKLNAKTTEVDASGYNGAIAAIASTNTATTMSSKVAGSLLTGSASSDTFNVGSTASYVTGDVAVIDGGSGSDTLNVYVKNAADLDEITAVETINIFMDASDTDGFGMVGVTTADGMDIATTVTLNGGLKDQMYAISGSITDTGAKLIDARNLLGSTSLIFAEDAAIVSNVSDMITIHGGQSATDQVTFEYDGAGGGKNSGQITMSGVERLVVESHTTNANTLDMKNMTGVTTITVTDGTETGTQLNVDNAISGLKFIGGTSTADQEFTQVIDVNLADATGTADVVTLELFKVTGSGSGIDATGIETVNLVATAAATTSTTITTSVAGTTTNGTVNVSGADADDEITLAGIAAGYTTVNASTLTGDLSIAASARASNAMTITAGLGSDTIAMENTADVLDGGTKASDNDTLVVSFSGTGGALIVDLSSSTDQVQMLNGLANAAAQKNFESVNASAYVQTNSVGADITGSTGANTIVGTAYADTIRSNGGGDTVTGGAGNDTIVLGTGADSVIFAATAAANGNDAITGFTTTSDKINLDALTTTTAYVTAAGGTQNVFTTGTQAVTIAAGKLYVVTTTTAGGADSASAAATAIAAAANWTEATAADVAYFVVVDNNSSSVWSMTEAAGSNEVVTAELTLMGTIDAVLVTGDIVIA